MLTDKFHSHLLVLMNGRHGVMSRHLLVITVSTPDCYPTTCF